MKATHVSKTLVLSGAGTAKRAEAIGSALRKANIIPKGGRGLFAPYLSAGQVIALSLAVVGAKRVRDAPDTAKQLADLVNKQGITLIETLSNALRHASLAADINRLLILSDLSRPENAMAEISYKTGPLIERFSVPEDRAARSSKRAAQGHDFVGRVGWLGGDVFQQIATGRATRSRGP